MGILTATFSRICAFGQKCSPRLAPSLRILTAKVCAYWVKGSGHADCGGNRRKETGTATAAERGGKPNRLQLDSFFGGVGVEV